jgi:hypothetical protein
MADAADALQQAHEAGLVHRDETVEPDGGPARPLLVIDFGLAGELATGRGAGSGSSPVRRAAHRDGRCGYAAVHGPGAVAAEKGVEPIARTDVYGLGVTCTNC